MKPKQHYVILGGGVAGTTAAAEIRKRDPEGEIMIINDEPYRLYSRVMLSKPAFFMEKVPFETVYLRKPEWYDQQKITLQSSTKIVSIDPKNKTLESASGRTFHYDKLLLAPGAQACPWTVPGSDKDGVYSLRTLDESGTIIHETKTAKRGLAIGGGFIGFEICDLFVQKNMDSTIIIREPYFWGALWDEQSGRMVENAMVKGGVHLIKGDEVVEVLGDDRVTGVRTKQGDELEADLIVVGIGVECSKDLFRTAGFEVNRGIIANEYLETGQPDVWVAGDAAEYNDVILDDTVVLGNWTHAQMQGRHAALNMTGERKPFAFVSSYKTTGFEISIAFVGDVRVKDGRDVLIRKPKDESWYTRILFEKDEIVGATLINKTTELKPLSDLIMKNVKVSSVSDQLVDPETELSTLVPS